MHNVQAVKRRSYLVKQEVFFSHGIYYTYEILATFLEKHFVNLYYSFYTYEGVDKETVSPFF